MCKDRRRSCQQVMQKTRLDIRLVVEEILRLLNRVIGENIEVAMSLPDVPLTVHADQGQIEQVIANIVVNARDAMISGGKLDISLCRSTEQESAATGLTAGDYAVIEVQDTDTALPLPIYAAFSSRFSPRKKSAREPVSGCRSPTAL